MLSKIFNTLRVLVDGPTEKQDEKLIPSQLFDTKLPFDDAVAELFETDNAEDIYEFLRLCVSADTSIAYRINDTQIIDVEGEEGIKATEYVDLLRTIDGVFASSPSVYGAGIMEGTVDRDPRWSGLAGRFLQLYTDTIGDPSDYMYKLVEINKLACQHNPSTLEAWWLDTLTNIYTKHEHVDEGDAVDWYDETDESSNSEIVQLWYLRLNPQLHRYISLAAEVLQNESPVGIMYKLIDVFSSKLGQIATLTEPGENLICEKSEDVEFEFPTTIEDTIFVLLSLAGETE